MVQPILIILVLAVALSAVLASRLSKHIIKPVLAIDLEHPEDSDTYEELTPLLSRIKQQNQTIAQQMAQLRQKQNEFTAITENMSEGFLLDVYKRQVPDRCLRWLWSGSCPPGRTAQRPGSGPQEGYRCPCQIQRAPRPGRSGRRR